MTVTAPTKELPMARQKGCALTTILVVEDQAAARGLVAEALSKAGLQVVEAPNADVAVKMLAKPEPVHLVLTDLNLPGSTNGLALARYARFSRPQVKVVFLSADAANDSLREWGDGFLFKPCEMGVMIQTVMNVLVAGGAQVRLQ